MTLSRRNFIKATLSAGCISTFNGIGSLTYASSGDKAPLLIVLFLRGGADGLSLVAPTADPDYIAARPADLRVLDEGEENLLINSIDKHAGFRFHPNAAALSELYRSTRMAVIHSVGILDATRSHFVAQELIEKGVNEERMLSSTESGWLARAINDRNGIVTGYSATYSTDISLHGSNSVLSAPDIATNFDVPWGKTTSGFLREMSNNQKTPIQSATTNTLNILETINLQQLRDNAGRVTPFSDSLQSKYEGSGELGRGLSSIARIASMDTGLKVATINHNGWDTHEGQANRFANQVKQLSIGLAAFDEVMQAHGNKYNLVVMTEFGRRLQSNKSGGTDHGHGACWLLLGDQVRGGKMYGDWPGLSNDMLDHGVDLAVTTDYRLVLKELLSTSGLNPLSSFNNLHQSVPLRLFV